MGAVLWNPILFLAYMVCNTYHICEMHSNCISTLLFYFVYNYTAYKPYYTKSFTPCCGNDDILLYSSKCIPGFIENKICIMSTPQIFWGNTAMKISLRKHQQELIFIICVYLLVKIHIRKIMLSMKMNHSHFFFFFLILCKIYECIRMRNA